MKEIILNGITYIEPLEGNPEWYWGTDYTHGDLYEAEEIYKNGYTIKSNRLVFVHYPDGNIYEPIIGNQGQYFGKPIYDKNRILILQVDFEKNKILIYQYDHQKKKTSIKADFKLSEIKNCYNLCFENSPLMLTRESDDRFQILYPEKHEVILTENESFAFREGDKLFFWNWHEDPDYREEIIVRDYCTNEIIDRYNGSIIKMPNGEKWILK